MASRRKRGRTEKISESPNEQNGNEEETLDGGTAVVDSGYEQFREQRIKENMERMQKLGILELSRKLKPETSSSRNISDKKALKVTPLEPSEPPRRSSRLESVAPVRYVELREKSKKEKPNRKIRIPEGSKPEVYTEVHDKLLGECNTTWTLYVDGCDKNGKRIYDPVKGETCHQCRQKTLGLHTHCSICDLVKGQLCGDCLYMRYGENVIEANHDSSWICPACRGICNCSLCRKVKGWAPTGNLYRKVLELGFKSVAHYLIQTRRSQPIPEDPDSENSNAKNVSSPFEEDEGPDASILEEDEGPSHDKDDKIEEEEEVHLLENKQVRNFSNPQPKDENDHGMEDEIEHEVEAEDIAIRGYNKDDDALLIKKEEEDDNSAVGNGVD